MQQRDCARRGHVRQGGFTLVELLTVVAITAILLAIGVPSFKNFMVRRQINGQAAELSRAFNLARSEAIKRNKPVTVCRSDNPEAAVPTCGTDGGDWTSGWIVYAGDTTTLPSAGNIIRVQPKWDGGGSVKVKSGDSSFTYSSMGLRSGGPLGLTFIIDPPSGMDTASLEQQWTLNLSGRWAVAAGSSD